jgi:hypothetical protein
MTDAELERKAREAAAMEVVCSSLVPSSIATHVQHMGERLFLAGHAAGARESFLDTLKAHRDLYLDHIEGTDAVEFEKWNRLYAAAADIVNAIEAEIPAAPKPEGEL